MLIGTRRPGLLLSLAATVGATVAILACAASEPAYARFTAPWARFIDPGNAEDMTGAYDTSRLVVQGDTVEVWMRFQYANPQPFPGDAARTFSVLETHQVVRCAAGQTSDIRMLLRDAADDSVGGYTTPSPRWIPFTEHGLSDRVLIRLCRAVPGGRLGVAAP